jgi:hypothetical protein
MEIYKAATPEAFDSNMPIDAATVFIDLQLRLQLPSGIEDWQQFFDALVGRTISRFLECPSVLTVVASYDDYTHSPLAKGPTQNRRKSRTAVPAWASHQPLPSMIPANYNQLLFNRNFKTRVVLFMIEQITLQTRLKFPNQRVIIDYQQNPYVAVGVGAAKAGGALGPGSEPVEATEFEVKTLLGESDLKWVRYLPLGNMILDAIDSDYVQISLCQIERLGIAAPKIYVRRLLLEASNAVLSAVAGGGKTKTARPKKRPLDQFLDNSTDDHENVVSTKDEDVIKKGRQYEYCDCNIIFKGMQKTFGKATPDELKPYTIRIVSYCVALVGSDFTRGVPWFNGTAAFKNMDVIWSGLCKAAIIDKGGVLSMDPRIVADHFIGKLWTQIQFPKLCGSSFQNASFETIYDFLSSNASIGAKRRELLITPRDLNCLCKGSNWTMHYWFDPENCPCAVHSEGDYGFIQIGSKTEFDNKKDLPVGQKKKAVTQGKIAWPV